MEDLHCGDLLGIDELIGTECAVGGEEMIMIRVHVGGTREQEMRQDRVDLRKPRQREVRETGYMTRSTPSSCEVRYEVNRSIAFGN